MYGSDVFPDLGFYRDAMGVVYLSELFCVGFGGPCGGVLIGGQVSVFTLPEGYRPAAREVFTAITCYFGRVDVDPTGMVIITAPPNDREDWVSLSGFTSPADH